MDNQDNSQTLAPGTLLNSGGLVYRIEKVLGSGSFGITYLATASIMVGNVTTQVKFAIKEHFMNTCYRDSSNNTTVLTTPASRELVESSRKDFLTEAQRLQRVCEFSRNIVKVNETFEANGTAYFVMEFLEGGSPRPMSEAQAVALVTELAQAVDVLHQAHLLHLDIKPDNIVMKDPHDGSPRYPVLIDFGVSKHFDSAGNPTTHMQAKGASSGYAPIEQYADIKGFSPRYDVYALGGVLLYLLSGSNPPSAFDVNLNQDQIKQLIPPDTSPHVAEAILHAMRKNAEERTPDASGFIRELNAVPVTAPNVAPASTTVHLTPSIPSAPPVPPVEPIPSAPPVYSIADEDSNASGNNKKTLLFLIIGILVVIGLGIGCYFLFNKAKPKGIKDIDIDDEFEEVELSLEQKAENGDADAMYTLAYCYLNGSDGYEQDDELGIMWLKNSAEAGNSSAQIDYGYNLQNGLRGLNPDMVEALDWYEKAAAQHDAVGCFDAGIIHLYGGDGVPVDYSKAFDYLSEAANLGYVDAYADLGNMYLDGLGVQTDDAMAVECYRYAAVNNNSAGCYDMGLCFENGYGLKQNLDSAYYYYQLSAQLGYEDGEVAAQRILKRLNK